MKLKKTYIVFSIPVLISIIAIAVLLSSSSASDQSLITGIVETNEIDVASKIPGRIDSIFVDEGDEVKKGQVLARLESKEMDAKLEQARALMEAAKSKMDMAHNGARPEEREAVQKQYAQAAHQFELASKTWKRIESLYNDQVISLQEKDQVEFQYKAAMEQKDAAKAKYDMVIKGARLEEIAGAEALYHQAQNGYNEVLAYHNELNLVCPVEGEICKRISDAGEIIAGGYPIFSIINTNNSYVVLQLREDQMTKIKKNNTYTGSIPALGSNMHEFVVTYISSMADFASWKATNQKGDFDLKTFEIRLKPKKPIEGLRPGMTVRIQL